MKNVDITLNRFNNIKKNENIFKVSIATSDLK
jgi:hypothetical protein